VLWDCNLDLFPVLSRADVSGRKGVGVGDQPEAVPRSRRSAPTTHTSRTHHRIALRRQRRPAVQTRLIWRRPKPLVKTVLTSYQAMGRKEVSTCHPPREGPGDSSAAVMGPTDVSEQNTSSHQRLDDCLRFIGGSRRDEESTDRPGGSQPGSAPSSLTSGSLNHEGQSSGVDRRLKLAIQWE
jgi:hypothetical protein